MQPSWRSSAKRTLVTLVGTGVLLGGAATAVHSVQGHGRQTAAVRADSAVSGSGSGVVATPDGNEDWG
ncbi:hypothetical protein [Streptomyces sp. NPDC059398]|uniref:hypothetical protein n=1 Tax=Streptomyces sp. NPDC059398 TaxID=3346820 RepID=UPI0036BB25B8